MNASFARAGTRRVSPDRLTENKINVLFVSSTLWIGGAETVIRHLAQAVDRSRFNVTVCCLKERGHIGEQIAAAGIDVIQFANPAGPKVDYLTFRKLLRVIRDRGIHVVHTHNVDGLADAALCKLLTPRLKHVHTFHFGNYPHARRRLLIIERLFATFADRLFSVGEVQRRQIRAVYKFSDRSIRTIWNGVPIPSNRLLGSFRQRVGAEGRLLIGTIATLIEQKGLLDLLRVARRVRDEHGDAVRFVIVGEGDLRSKLERMRHELGLDETVVLTGWVTNAADVALPEFDVFFQPSLWEAMSVVILEAMSRSLPIVATRVGENPHIIEHAVDGLLVHARDVDGMATALSRLVRDPDLRCRLGTAARRKVEQRLTVDHMARAYEQVYLELLR